MGATRWLRLYRYLSVVLGLGLFRIVELYQMSQVAKSLWCFVEELFKFEVIAVNRNSQKWLFYDSLAWNWKQEHKISTCLKIEGKAVFFFRGPKDYKSQINPKHAGKTVLWWFSTKKWEREQNLDMSENRKSFCSFVLFSGPTKFKSEMSPKHTGKCLQQESNLGLSHDSQWFNPVRYSPLLSVECRGL